MHKQNILLFSSLITLLNFSLYGMEKKEIIATLYTEEQIKEEPRCGSELERKNTPVPQKIAKKQTNKSVSKLDLDTIPPKKSDCCVPCTTYCGVYRHCWGAVLCSKHDSCFLRMFLGCIISIHACIVCNQTCCNSPEN